MVSISEGEGSTVKEEEVRGREGFVWRRETQVIVVFRGRGKGREEGREGRGIRMNLAWYREHRGQRFRLSDVRDPTQVKSQYQQE